MQTVIVNGINAYPIIIRDERVDVNVDMIVNGEVVASVEFTEAQLRSLIDMLIDQKGEAARMELALHLTNMARQRA